MQAKTRRRTTSAVALVKGIEEGLQGATQREGVGFEPALHFGMRLVLIALEGQQIVAATVGDPRGYLGPTGQYIQADQAAAQVQAVEQIGQHRQLAPLGIRRALRQHQRLRIMRRLHALRHRRQLLDLPPTQLAVVAAGVMHPPDLAQRPHHRHRTGLCRRGGRIQRLEQEEAVRADLEGERLARLSAPGQAVVLDAARVALEPGRRRDRAQPVRHDRGQVVEGGAQRLADQLEEMQVVHGGQHMRAVGPLLAARLDQATGLEALEHPVEQQVLRVARPPAAPGTRSAR